MQHSEADDLPRVLLENYLLLAASLESQNTGRLSDMLQYSQKVHHNLLEVMQQIEDAPTLAMTADQAPPHAAAAAGLQDPLATTAPQFHPQQSQPQQHVPQQRQQQQPRHRSQPPSQHDLQQADADLHTHEQPLQQQQQPPPPPPPLQQQQQQAPAVVPSWLQHVNVSVEQLLSSLGLSQYVPVLQQQQVDMAALQLMEERHLRELGLPLGAVVKIRAALTARGSVG